MKINSHHIFLLLIVVVFLGCQTKSSQNPKDYSDSLVVLSGASNISYAKVNQTDQVAYNLKVDYPATEVIKQLLRKLDDKGWSPLKEDYLNPGLPTSFVRGWTNYKDMSKQPNTVVNSWQSDWQNKKEDILVYILNYRNSINTEPDMSSLAVVAIYVPADIAQAMKKASLETIQKYGQQQKSGSK